MSPSRFQLAWPGVLLLMLLLGAWEVAARFVDSANFPGVMAVAIALRNTWSSLWQEMGITLMRAGAGLLLALVTMLPLGIFIGRVRAIGDFIEPLFDLLRPLPPLAIVPLAMLFAGVGSTAKILVIFYSVSFPILLGAVDAVRSAHPMLGNVARSLRLSRREIMLQIDLPAALPQVVVGIRIGVALALLVSVSAEMLLSTDGIGTLIVRAQEQFRIANGLAALAVIALTALAINITYNSSVYTLDALASLKGGGIRKPEAGLEAMYQLRTRGPGLWDQESIAVGWLKSGEIWATPYFSGNVLAMMRDPDLADLRFCVPSEGGYALPMSVTRVVNPSAGDQPERFINHMLGVEAQEAWARIGNARPVNKKARVPDEVAATVPTADKLRNVDWGFFAEQRSAIVDQWNKVVNR